MSDAVKVIAAMVAAMLTLFALLAFAFKPGDAMAYSADVGRFSASGGAIAEYIITDNETGVQYLFATRLYGGGLTVLVDADGKPLMKEEA